MTGQSLAFSAEDADEISEIFQTPLTGSYSWDYATADASLRRLYRLGKERNWNADVQIDWSGAIPRSEPPTDYTAVGFPYAGWEPYEQLSDASKLEFAWHLHAWTQSQLLHGEQGALLVASQLVSCAPTMDAKIFAASQTFDEARHVEVFARYLREHVGITYPVAPDLKWLLDQVLTDERWDLKFIGMQLVIESLALASFQAQRLIARSTTLKQILDYVGRDESRHVAFGVTYMEALVKSLEPEEIEARAEFAFQACRIMRDRLFSAEVLSRFGLDVEAAREKLFASEVMRRYRNLLFTRIVPNLRRVGLLTDRVAPKYESLGVLAFRDFHDDGDIAWHDLQRPLGDGVS